MNNDYKINKIEFKKIPRIAPGHGEYLNIFRILDAEEFKKSKYIYLIDHMPASYDFKISLDGKKEYSKNSIIDLLHSIDINSDDKIFVTESYTNLDSLKLVLIDTHNHYFIEQANDFLKAFPDHRTIPEFIPSKKFTFMSNKPRPNRMVSSVVCANLFDSNDISYTFTESDNQTVIASELLLDTDYDLTIKFLDQYWIRTDDKEYLYDLGIVYNDICAVYRNMKDQLFYNSATSMITEPVFYEKGNMFTEKTMMSIYSGHFLIWPGMHKAAETFKKLGFDVFDDIIDHSYQYIEHPGKRIVEAFLRNFEFLNDIKLQASYRHKFKDRLNHNLNLARDPARMSEAMLDLTLGSAELDNRQWIIELQEFLSNKTA
jgi:hypothetical protein